MSLFNSLGSNYNLSFVLKTFFSRNKEDYKQKLRDYLSNKYGGNVLLTYKGREAITMALQTLNLPEDSFVAINGFTCFAVYEAITKAQLNVDYIDIEKEDLNFSAKQLLTKLNQNPKIKVVIIQNTLGYPCEIEQIAKICKEKNVILIEDLAHSVGTIYQNNQETGNFGDFVILSFSQDKIIDAVSGGALIIREKKYRKKISNLTNLKKVNQIKDRLYPLFTYIIRTTYSTELGKIIHVLLKMLNLLSKPMDNNFSTKTIAPWYCRLIADEFNQLGNNLLHRRKIASIYSENINNKILSSKLLKNVLNSTNLRFPIFVKNRQSLINYLAQNGIYVSDIWYDAPIAPLKYMNQTSYNNQCPNSEKISSTILNLPTHINISEKDAENISALTNEWLKLQ